MNFKRVLLLIFIGTASSFCLGMEKSLQIAQAKNKQLVWLGVWEHNYRAIDFYTRWGFSKFGEHPFILGTDMQTDWMMVKHLNGKHT